MNERKMRRDWRKEMNKYKKGELHRRDKEYKGKRGNGKEEEGRK